MQLNKPSGLSLEEFQKVLKDDKDVNKIFEQNAQYFYYVEKQYNINGLFVAAIGIHESNWGTSKIAKDKKNLLDMVHMILIHIMAHINFLSIF